MRSTTEREVAKPRAVFLDRDGVINEVVYYKDLGLINSPLNPEQFRLLPNADEAIRLLNELGIITIIVSNQPAIGKGKMTLDLFERIRKKMHFLLAKRGAAIDGEYYCLHHPDACLLEYKRTCQCRKPKPGLILEAAKDFALDLKTCYMIGDGLNDVIAGKAAGCRTILIGRLKCDMCRVMDEEAARPDLIVPDLLSAIKAIVNGVSEPDIFGPITVDQRAA